MKKDERLIQEMIYINSKKNFNLNDLIGEFDISRSTALRDISSFLDVYKLNVVGFDHSC